MRDSNEYTDTRPDFSSFGTFNLSYEPDLQELLNCVLGISKSETRTYFALLQNQDVDIQTLADVLDRAESTLREQVAALREARLVTRDTRVPESGLRHTYRAVPLDEVEPSLREAIAVWGLDAVRRIECLTDSSIDRSTESRSTTSDLSSSSTSTEEPSIAARELWDNELPSLRSISTCVFGIPYPELELYLVLLEYPRSTAQELAENQNFARTTVVGRLNALQDRGFARPAGRETESGSIAYEYIPRPLDEVKKAMIEQLHEEWIEYAQDCIDEFDASSVAGLG